MGPEAELAAPPGSSCYYCGSACANPEELGAHLLRDHAGAQAGTALPPVPEGNLSKEDEIRLALIAKGPGPEALAARRTLVEKNLGLVWSIARRYQNRGVPVADLVQDGSIGLMKAVDKFDPSRGTRFSTYAIWLVEQAIRDEVIKTGRTIRLPNYVNDAVFKAQRLMRQMAGPNGAPPDLKDVALAMDMDPDHLAELLSRGAVRSVSMDASGPGGDDYHTLKDEIAAPEEAPASMMPVELKRLVGALNTREIHVVSRRFGLDGKPPATLTEIAHELGESRERIRQIEDLALRFLRKNCVVDKEDGSEPEILLPDETVKRPELPPLRRTDFKPVNLSLEGAPARKTPQVHQEEALDAIVSEFKTKARATVVMACGTGKTMVGLWASHRLDARTTLVLSPSLALIRQTLREWRAHEAADEYLCICSDKTVNQADQLQISEEDLGIPVTTDAEEVRRSLARTKGRTVVFCTYHSIKVLAAGLPKKFQFDLALFDEAHRTAGRRERDWSFGLSDRNLRARKKLFLTATPCGIVEDDDAEENRPFSMYDKSVYGRHVYTLGLSEAIRREIICDYRIVIGVVTRADVKAACSMPSRVSVGNETLSAHAAAYYIALSRAIQECGAQKVVTFHGSIAQAKTFSESEWLKKELLPEGFRTYHVSGRMPIGMRQWYLDRFKEAPRSLITNARCLNEGVDLPSVDMVAFMVQKRSRIDIIQTIGRALRKSPGKSIGYVLLPIMVDENGNPVSTSEEYRDLSQVIWSLRSQDETLEHRIRAASFARGHSPLHPPLEMDDRMMVCGPEILAHKLRAGIGAKIISPTGSSWDEMFGRLVAYKKDNGTCFLKKGDEDLQLSNWVHSQRRRRRRRLLSPRQVQLLESLGFAWSTHEQKWEETFHRLEDWKKRNVHLDVMSVEDVFLSYWVYHQRKLYAKHRLSDKQIARLEALGFDWKNAFQRLHSNWWQRNYDELVRWKEEHGNCDVPTSQGRLGRFVAQQRFQHRTGSLVKERRERLDKLGFIWTPSLDEVRDKRWLERLAELEAWKAQYGNCDVPTTQGRLGHWVHSMRRRKKQGLLSKVRIDRLEAMGFHWTSMRPEAQDRAWTARLRQLVAFRKKHGHCNVAPSHDVKLQMWVNHQREAKKKERLTPERIGLLEKAGLTWRLRTKIVKRDVPASTARRQIGDVVTRKEFCNGRVVECRFIKVSDEGPANKRWIAYARWWWEKNRGPVPKGMGVIHKNGIQIDDRPDNLMVGGPGDRIRLAHVNNPAMSRRNMRTVHEGCAAWNRKQGRLNRFKNVIRNYWYPVLEGSKVVLNVPFRKRIGVLRHFGADVSKIPMSGHGPEVELAIAQTGVVPVPGTELEKTPYSRYARVDVEFGIANPEQAGADAEKRMRAIEGTPVWHFAKAAAQLDTKGRK